jgi:hypothetical protein
MSVTPVPKCARVRHGFVSHLQNDMDHHVQRPMEILGGPSLLDRGIR